MCMQCIADLMFCHSTQTMENSRFCHCLLFLEHGKQNFVQPFLQSRKLLQLHTLRLNFTMKSWAESLALLSVIIHGPYMKQTQLLGVGWLHHLWAAYPCLSWSTVAMRALTWVIFTPGFFHTDTALWQVALHWPRTGDGMTVNLWGYSIFMKCLNALI